MTAPSTFTVTATFYDPDNTLAAGTVEFKPVDQRFKNNANIIDQEVIVAVLDGSGSISQVLIQATNGYTVTEKITGRTATPSYQIAGTANINLSTV